MSRSRAAIAAGLLVVLAAFAYGVEVTSSTTVAGQEVGCGPAISGSWLMSGTDSPRIAEPTTDERAATAACEPVVQRSRIGVLSSMAAGGLLALLGWTALSSGPREPRRAGRPDVRTT